MALIWNFTHLLLNSNKTGHKQLTRTLDYFSLHEPEYMVLHTRIASSLFFPLAHLGLYVSMEVDAYKGRFNLYPCHHNPSLHRLSGVFLAFYPM